MVFLALARVFTSRIRHFLNTSLIITESKMKWISSVDALVERVGQQVALV